MSNDEGIRDCNEERTNPQSIETQEREKKEKKERKKNLHDLPSQYSKFAEFHVRVDRGAVTRRPVIEWIRYQIE